MPETYDPTTHLHPRLRLFDVSRGVAYVGGL